MIDIHGRVSFILSPWCCGAPLETGRTDRPAVLLSEAVCSVQWELYRVYYQPLFHKAAVNVGVQCARRCDFSNAFVARYRVSCDPAKCSVSSLVVPLEDRVKPHRAGSSLLYLPNGLRVLRIVKRFEGAEVFFEMVTFRGPSYIRRGRSLLVACPRKWVTSESTVTAFFFSALVHACC